MRTYGISSSSVKLPGHQVPRRTLEMPNTRDKPRLVARPNPVVKAAPEVPIHCPSVNDRVISEFHRFSVSRC
ncbi:hypothetical protein D3C75_1336030 [compost metagenome]